MAFKLFNSLATPKYPFGVAVNSIKVARRIIAASATASQITEEDVPGVRYQSDEELLLAARECSQTIYHPAGT